MVKWHPAMDVLFSYDKVKLLISALISTEISFFKNSISAFEIS